VTEPVQALIMAGGEGSRLRPLTSSIPKPMLPVCNRPLMEHIVRLLHRHGMTEICATVQFLSSVIRNYFDDGSELGVSISYSTEEVPLGTAGSVLNARDLLSDTFLVISGDALTDLDPGEVIDFHRSRGAAATMVLKRMQDPLEFGIVMTGEGGKIERFLEKPSWGQVFTDTVNTGIYVLEPEVLDLIPPGQPYDFSSELFPMMLDKGLPLYGFVTDAYWTDVGNSAAYLAAQRDAMSGAVDVAIPGFELTAGVWAGEDVDIDPSARIVGPAVIGDNSRIGPAAAVGPYAVLGSNAIVDADARVEGGVVMERGHLDELSSLRGGILGRRATLDRAAVVEEGAVIGDEVDVGADALIKSQVKIYPSRSVEAGAIVTQSVVTEHRATRSLFGARGVAGIMNVGLTPVTAVRLGMAFGTMLKRRSVVVSGRDASRAARTIKRALIAGINSTGVTCHDLELTTMPLVRFSIRSGQRAGGLHVRTSPGHPGTVEIRLFDGDGADLPPSMQRKVERIFFREEYRGPTPQRLGELEFPPHAPGQYVAGLLGTLDLHSIRGAAPKVVMDYAFGPAALIGPAMMGRLGCDVLSVNAYTDEQRPVLSPVDLDALLSHLVDRVKNSGADVGVLLEPGGEVVHVVDDAGRLLSNDQLLLLFVAYESRRRAGAVAVPVSATRECENLASAYGTDVQRTPTGLASLMERAGEPGTSFAADAEGTLIFPDFMPAPDALASFSKVLELIAASGEPLSEIVDRLPEVHVVKRDVRTPWQLKGAVMRHVSSRPGPGRLVLLDGVKVVQPDRWALVLPLAHEPVCRIYAEAPTAREAAELAERYAAMVQGVVDGQGTSTS
jgi:mannose-1-phosphate guanylyltransferase/phosphomannomutase